MDTQPIPSQSPSPGGERPMGYRPEDLQVAGPEQPARQEQASAPGASVPVQQTPAQQPAAQTQMTRDDAMRAIAATPGPAGAATGVPVAADDADVIEPAWVDAAEHVIAQHQGDPYGEEEAIEDLNRDYLEKRYGYHVGDPDEGGK